MLDRYGAPLHRVPVDFGFGCPHRRPDGSGGCTFCPEDGGRAELTASLTTLEEQIRAGIAFARTRYGATRFSAYIQAFTGTFAPASRQRAGYERLLRQYPFDAVSIGTRPDCLPPATLDFLCELNERIEVCVEVGVQTAHDETLRRINRGHDWTTAKQAIETLHKRGIAVAVHVILGLPGEVGRHFRTTAERLGKLPILGIKIHNLHVVRETDLAKMFREEPFPVYNEHEYGDILIDFLRRLPPAMAIMRINTDTPPARLIAPRWAMKKGQFRDYVVRTMKRRGAVQGDLFELA